MKISRDNMKIVYEKRIEFEKQKILIEIVPKLKERQMERKEEYNEEYKKIISYNRNNGEIGMWLLD